MKSSGQGNTGRRVSQSVEEATLIVARSVVRRTPRKAYESLAAAITAFLQRGPEEFQAALEFAGLSQSDVVDPNTADFLDAGGSDSISPRTIRRALDVKEDISTTNAYVNTLYIYIYCQYKIEFDSTYAEVLMATRQRLACEVRKSFNDKEPLTEALSSRFAGTYELCRNFHLSPRTQVMISRLVLGPAAGPEKDPFGCRMECRFEDGGHDVHETYAGKFIPFQNRLMITLSDGNHARFVLYVDHYANTTSPTELAGAMIADARVSGQASVWPFFARKMLPGEDAELRVVSAEDISARVRDQLQRGALYYRDFPGFPPHP